MKIVNLSYNISYGFTQPEDWLLRINASTGILEQLSRQHNVISIEQINYSGYFEQHGVQYQFLDFGKKSTWFPWRLHRVIKKMKADIIIVNGLIFPLQVIQLRLSVGKKARIIVQHHAEMPFRGIKKYLQRMADTCIDAYLFVSLEMGMEWIDRGNLPKAGKIHEVMEASSVFYPIDKKTAIAKTGVDGSPVFLWVGRLDQNKDPLTVVKAFLQYIKNYPDAKLYMIYHTTELIDEIKALLNDNTVNEKAVEMIGKTHHNDMLYWFNSADYIISGSHYEGAGVAVCEAMSCGCIPVLTGILSFKKMTGDGKCGILYETGNEQSLLNALNQITGRDIRGERNKVLQQFKANLSFDAIA